MYIAIAGDNAGAPLVEVTIARLRGLLGVLSRSGPLGR